MTQMEITPSKLAKLKRAYFDAIKDSQDDFVFDGHLLATGYAKYLIEYLTNRIEGEQKI